MKIVMLASESEPFCKTGGLADVVYSLSKELVILGHEVYIIMPFYKFSRVFNSPTVKHVSSFSIDMSWRKNLANVYETQDSGITYYLIDNDFYFNRDGVYGYNDDGERFAFFNLAAKELLYRLNLKPDVIHCHDWHVGMFSCLIKEDPYSSDFFKNAKHIFTIHNPAFQGMNEKEILSDCYNLPVELYYNGTLKHQDKVSTLKAGIMYADKITTVSPNHRKELLTPEGGMQIDGILSLRKYDFVGILNGIDYSEWNPREDEKIDFPYNDVDAINKKQNNKISICRYFHLNNSKSPLFSFISRLTWQKGIDILLPTFEKLLNEGCNVVVLGNGDSKYELAFEELRNRYPNNFGLYIGFNSNLSHQIFAGSDFILVPSLFEPCGLTQMIAQRYGALPIVRETGGLKDSVICFNGKINKTGNGFSFFEYSSQVLSETCERALSVYRNEKFYKNLVKNAMNTDNSWCKSANEYLKLYASIK